MTDAILLETLLNTIKILRRQVILSPVGFKIAQNWRKNGVGHAYVDLVDEAKEVNMTGKEIA